jgi:hypothetical protein
MRIPPLSRRRGASGAGISTLTRRRFDWPIADTRKLRSNNFTTLLGAEVHAMATSAGEY